MEVLNGSNLVQTIVSLTELPEPLVHQEMNEILQLSGHQSETLTLEQLRAAMLSYLEEIQASMEAEGVVDLDAAHEVTASVAEIQNDAPGSKLSVISE